jgi:hypothetical protein
MAQVLHIMIAITYPFSRIACPLFIFWGVTLWDVHFQAISQLAHNGAGGILGHVGSGAAAGGRDGERQSVAQGAGYDTRCAGAFAANGVVPSAIADEDDVLRQVQNGGNDEEAKEEKDNGP